jgi:hypothetical protein
MKRAFVLCALLAGTILTVSCGGQSGAPDEQRVTPSATLTPTAEPTTVSRERTPPLEGPIQRLPTLRTNYREDPDFQFPNPADLPIAGPDIEGAQVDHSSPSGCPVGWERLVRPREGFEICYPGDWIIDGHGYVTAGADDRWYSLGIFRLVGDDSVESAHVSVYVMGPYSRPFTYVLSCEKAYQVTLAGELASFCPDHPGEFPEVKIMAYHLRQGDRDYFIQVVPHFTWSEQTKEYLDVWSKEDEETAIRIVHTLQLVDDGVGETPTATPE